LERRGLQMMTLHDYIIALTLERGSRRA